MSDSNNPLEQLENKVVERRQRQYLPSSVILEETQSLPTAKLAITVICAALLLGTLWAGFTQVEETAATFGEVIPSGHVQVVQHLEGGIIEKVLVKDGDRVTGGKSVLVQMDPVNALNELQELQAREIALLVDAERLRAFATEKEKEFKAWMHNFMNNKNLTPVEKKIVENTFTDELFLFDLQSKARADQREILLSQIKQHNEEATLLLEQKNILERHLDLLAQEKKMYDSLSTVSRRDMLELLRQINKANGDLTTVISKHQQNKQSLFEVQNRLSELNSSLREKAIEELDDINANLEALRNRLNILQSRVKRLDVYAPISGIVNGLNVSPGSVLPSGGEICQIVPEHHELIVETHINPKDIGHIVIGDKVKVKVQSFDFSRYGLITGRLTNISATTFENEDGATYYKGTVTLDQQYVGTNPKVNQLKSGMTVEADIITGSKSLLSYLIKPIQAAGASAFRER